MSRTEKSYSTIIEIDRHGNPHYVLKIDSNKPDSEDEYANLLFKPLELYVSKNVLEQDKEPRENKEHKERGEHKEEEEEEEEAKKKRKYNSKNQNVSNDSSSTNEPTISLEDRAQFLNENPGIIDYIEMKNISFRMIYEGLLENGWEELEKSVLKGKAPLALSTRAWVRPDAIPSWNKDNFGNLTLNCHYFWSNPELVSYLRQSSTILNYLSDQDFTDVTQQALLRLQAANKNKPTIPAYSSTRTTSGSKSSSLKPSPDIFSKSSSRPSSEIIHVNTQQENHHHLSSKHYKNKNDLTGSQTQTQTQTQTQSSSQSSFKSKSYDSNTILAKGGEPEQNKYVCPQCNKQCMNNISLWHHKKSCIPFIENEKISKDKEGDFEDKKYLCPQCNKEFTNNIGFSNHKRTCVSVNENDSFNFESNGDGIDNLDTSFSDSGRERKKNNPTIAKSTTDPASSSNHVTNDDVISPEIIKTAFHYFLHDNYDKVKFEMGQATSDEKIMSNIRHKWNKLHSKDPTCVYELKTYLNLAKKTIIQHVIPESSDDEFLSPDDKKRRLTMDKKDSLAEQPTGPDQKGLKVTKYYEFDISTPEAHLRSILDFRGSNSYFPFTQLWKLLLNLGWNKWSVPRGVAVAPKRFNAYFASWTEKSNNEKQPTVVSKMSSDGEVLEGRDFFYENDHLVEYLKQFGNNYDEVGISHLFKVEDSNRKRRRVSGPDEDILNEISIERAISSSSSTAVSKSMRKQEKVDAWLSRLRAEGFDFEENKDIYIGKRIRRFFYIGPSDGMVICCKLESIDNPPMYGVLHDDKDTEILDLIDIQRGYNDLIQNRIKEPFDYNLNEAIDNEFSAKKLEEMEKTMKDKIAKAVAKAEKDTNDAAEKRLKAESKIMQEKYHRSVESYEKKLIIKDKLDHSLAAVRSELQNCKQEKAELIKSISILAAQKDKEIMKIKQESIDKIAKIRVDIQFLNSSTNSTSSNLSQQKTLADPNLRTSQSPEIYNLLVDSWREYLNELSSGERAEKVAAFTRNSEYFLETGGFEPNKYPVRITVDQFNKWNTKERLTAPIRVMFQRMELLDGRVRRSTQFHDENSTSTSTTKFNLGSRQRVVQDTAYDAGGLLRQWLGDFFSALRSFFLPAEYFPKIYLDDGDELTAFVSKGSRYLPPAIYIDSQRSIPINISNILTSVEPQNNFIVNLYTTIGKVINQVFREEKICLPESFGSPLLLYYLLAGSNWAKCMSAFSYQELESHILDFDMSYYGYLNYLNDSTMSESDSQRKKSLLDFIEEKIYFPRKVFLDLIKKGFDYVPISSHLLPFSYSQLKNYFIGIESISSEELKSSLVFEDSFDSEFIESFYAMISKMSNESRRQFLIFATGMPYLNSRTSAIQINKSLYASDQMTRWPIWPLPKSFTCFNQIILPFSNEMSSFDPDNLLENFSRAFEHNKSDFSDDIIEEESSPNS